jgi:hypothetical protein
MYNEKGVNVWGIGKHLKMVYIVETTKNNPEVETMYFSNIHQFKHDTIESAMKHILIMQRQGWHNININVQVYNRDQLIVEDIAYETQFVSTTEQETMRDNKRLMEQMESAQEEINAYKGFIKKYKAEKTFEKYTEELKNENKDNSGLYWYELLYRPLSIGGQPKGFIDHDHTKGRHGIVAYNRPLTEKEINEYELKKWNTLQTA